MPSRLPECVAPDGSQDRSKIPENQVLAHVEIINPVSEFVKI